MKDNFLSCSYKYDTVNRRQKKLHWSIPLRCRSDLFFFSENVIINQQRHVYQINEKGLFAAGIQPTPLVQQQKSLTKLMQRVQPPRCYEKLLFIDDALGWLMLRVFLVRLKKMYIDDGEAHHSI